MDAARVLALTAMLIQNPFVAARLYVDPGSPARRQADAWRRSRPADAALILRIASQPVARWFGSQTINVRREVADAVSTIRTAKAVPVFVVYDIPLRDCGSHSAGGAQDAARYRQWIHDFAEGVGGHQTIVILEPDALAAMDCLSTPRQQERVALIRDAVQALKAHGASVYIDAGHPRWQPAEEMARRLNLAGIALADGFALNVANLQSTPDNIAYGERLSGLVGGKHFVIDTSRNGIPASGPGEWCNPRGRALGVVPTTRTSSPLADAFLWIKPPGDSDGTCGGGPPAGTWWAEYALELSRLAAAHSGAGFE